PGVRMDPAAAFREHGREGGVGEDRGRRRDRRAKVAAVQEGGEVLGGGALEGRERGDGERLGAGVEVAAVLRGEAPEGHGGGERDPGHGAPRRRAYFPSFFSSFFSSPAAASPASPVLYIWITCSVRSRSGRA